VSKTNYIKLTARSLKRLDDADSVRRLSSDTPSPLTAEGMLRIYVTDWTFPCGRDPGEARDAVRRAEKKLRALRRMYPGLDAKAFQLSSLRPVHLPGVDTIGEPRCPITAMALAHESAVCS
jgi:hypothetical protein